MSFAGAIGVVVESVDMLWVFVLELRPKAKDFNARSCLDGSV